ncbi:hypothetical protein Taro_037689 [Colocasia esculenta]|uniref:Uncharacterized protein n=1 Tax=Colocasia esculenta TaxID=4460 RepID=A0A843WAJ1_COLES|nr:hypothetical protein [Colocasia esculenta]
MNTIPPPLSPPCPLSPPPPPPSPSPPPTYPPGEPVAMESWERLLGYTCGSLPLPLLLVWDWDFGWNMSEVIPHIEKSTGLRLAPNPGPTASTTTANLKTPSLLSFP